MGRAGLPGSSLGVCKFALVFLPAAVFFLSGSQFASSVALRSSFQAPSLEAATAYLIPGIRGSGQPRILLPVKPGVDVLTADARGRMRSHFATLASDQFLPPHAPVYCFGSGCPPYEAKASEIVATASLALEWRVGSVRGRRFFWGGSCGFAFSHRPRGQSSNPVKGERRIPASFRRG